MQLMRMGVAVATAVLLATGLTGCGEEGVDVPAQLTSQVDDRWEVVEDAGSSYAVGHGLVVQVDAGWTTYGDEREGIDGSTFEWAIGLPNGTKPFPAALQMSAGQENTGAQIDRGMAEAAEEIARVSPGYELLDKGDVDVPGASEAKFLRFLRDVQLSDGSTAKAEQVTLMIGVADGVSSSIRFTAPQGEWDTLMKQAYESVKVTSEANA